jgi:PAS domain S-box-containing protein
MGRWYMILIIFKWLKVSWIKYNPFDISDYFDKVMNSMSKVEHSMSEIKEQLIKTEYHLEKELQFYKATLTTIGDTIPDMMWLKGVDGKYIYANKAIKKGLLFECDPIGKTDVEMALAAREKYGPENHTFGEKCANSDTVVLQELKPMRFLESGNIKGKMVYLEVFKAPLYVGDELVGVCGTGRDMTEYVETFRNNNCKGCGKMDDIFSKYEFGGDDGTVQ